MLRKGRVFKVKLDLPENVSPQEMNAYIFEAVSIYCKSLNPGTSEADFTDADPLFDLDQESISVTCKAGE